MTPSEIDTRRRRLHMPMAELCRRAGLPYASTWRLLARRELGLDDVARLDRALRVAEHEIRVALAMSA